MRIDLLDHGYVQLIETWGSEEQIIEAARMSTGKGFLGWGGGPCPDIPHDAECRCKGARELPPGDEKLLRFLWENKHATPFEMAGLTFEVMAPIFVFREWHRHRTQSYNELSARYTKLPNLQYVPGREVLQDRCKAAQKTTNKQAQGASTYVASEHELDYWYDRLREVYNLANSVYTLGLNYGIPKELARLPIPVAAYSRMRASANLRNWLGFLTLRMAPGAQWEIRQYANAVGQLIADNFPRTWELFQEGNVN